MKTIIIEDEQIAANNLERLLKSVDSEIEVERILQTVEESIEYFNHTTDTELVFVDIHLADGLAFRIFDKVSINCPIIFITSYDRYALDAFKVNSIDYLLKPISKEDLTRALNKCKFFTQKKGNEGNITQEQLKALTQGMQQKKYKSYFLIPVQNKLIPLNVNDIAYVYLDDKISRIVTFKNETHLIDKPLDTIYTQLNPEYFFRANRQYIISHKAIESINLWPLSKLNVSLNVEVPEKIIISRARSTEFKEWYIR